MDAILDLLVKQVITSLPVGQLVLVVLGGLVVLGTTYILVTPTQDDDHWLQQIEANKWAGALLRVLVRFSPIERKAQDTTQPPTQ